jgi:hypothetical protein
MGAWGRCVKQGLCECSRFSRAHAEKGAFKNSAVAQALKCAAANFTRTGRAHEHEYPGTTFRHVR